MIAGDVDTGDLMQDLSALMDWPDDSAPASVSWVDRVREAVFETPDSVDLEQLARQAGVHRASMSRAYQRRFGRPISLDRRRAKLARSIRVMLEDGESAAMAAYVGGFSDQPHFSKVMRSELGITPRVLKAALR